MYEATRKKSVDYIFILLIALLVLISLATLNSIETSIFPTYFLYLGVGALAFLIFSRMDFEVFSTFYKQLYIFSIIFLILPLIIGQVTRGAIRWIPIGALTIQPSEIVRPLLLIFFAKILVENEFTAKFLISAIVLFLVPILLIVVQPSLGVAAMTAIGILGVLLASGVKKKYIATGFMLFLLSLPVSWFLMEDYQKQRVVTFINPEVDPLGTGYNSIQSMISVGSGKLTGRGLGKGVQTQLAFLPEKHTDFIFASVAEEMGFVGAGLLLLITFALFWKLIAITEKAEGPVARAYVSGFFLTLLAQVIVHVGMNMGLVPITGLPYPLVSAGGSSFIATMAGLGIAVGARKT